MITLSPQTSLEQIFDALETGIILYEPVFSNGNGTEPTDFAIAYCNQKAAEMNTVTHDTMKVQRVLSLVNVPVEGRKMIFEQVNSVHKTGQQSVSTFHNSYLDRYFQQTRTKLGNAVLTEVKDVTAEILERRECERQSAFTDQILDQSINGWFTCDAVRSEDGEIIDFIITRINAAFTSLVGLSEDAVVGKAYLSLFPTAKQVGTFSLNCRVLSSGIAERKLVHYVGDGFNAWYDIVASRLGNNTLLINFADISILGDAPYGIIQYKAVYDDKGNLVDFTHSIFNKVALDLAGLSFDEMNQKTAYQIAGERNNRRLVDMAAQVLKTGTPARFEYFVQAKATWVDLSLVRYEDGVLMNFIDITPRILQEQKVQQVADQFSRIIDASLNAIYAWKAIRDPQGAIVDFQYTLLNKAYEKLNGTMAGEVIGKTALQLYPGLKGTELFDRYAQVVETGESVKF
jgi:PAS domain-containing protein